MAAAPERPALTLELHRLRDATQCSKDLSELAERARHRRVPLLFLALAKTPTASG
jgi:hypothetical protein